MRYRLLVVALCAAVGLGLLPGSVQAEGEALYTVRQRMGVALARRFEQFENFPGELSDYGEVENLGFGWYSDWSMRVSPERPPGIEYVQLVETKTWPPNWSKIDRVAAANPGALWIVGNEPETRGQGQHAPDVYAQRYHDVYVHIKDVDASATIAIGGVVMPTPLRLEWLDLCLQAYEDAYGQPMPVDVWNIHMQILQEKRGDWGCGIPFGLDDNEGRLYTIHDNCSVEIFEQLIWEFCVWLDAHGQRDKPVIISEYGVLMPSSYLPYGDQSVLDFMLGTSDFLLSTRDAQLGCVDDSGRLIQRWLWFSLNFPSYDEMAGGFNGALYDWHNPAELTVFGEFYKAYAAKAQQAQRLYLPLVLTLAHETGHAGGVGHKLMVAPRPDWVQPMASGIEVGGGRLSGIVLPSPKEYAAFIEGLEGTRSGAPRAR